MCSMSHTLPVRKLLVGEVEEISLKNFFTHEIRTHVRKTRIMDPWMRWYTQGRLAGQGLCRHQEHGIGKAAQHYGCWIIAPQIFGAMTPGAAIP